MSHQDPQITQMTAVDPLLELLAVLDATRAEERAELDAMTTEQRQAAYATGLMTAYQWRDWYQRYPHETPLTSLTGPGEFFHILCKTPEYLGE
ncbi:hypothetical protein GKE82_25570 [Conexibacter sp. W3-3-2]|uniref:hypothetical protein n=1 Tax=Conexibacter sp. W3-3-2 TaxID=2675227 RepID=UPI0012B73AC6|nr:hypothetical protein [Conexibacter sp. W3-3-2]MTD47438.1 hypothetical protein [Conexibacter sp. W3-3-2]MTD47577.1 hypothetical protein [Conexibacter sp. W3-3-2]